MWRGRPAGVGEVVQGPWGQVSWRKGRPLPPDEAGSRSRHPAGKKLKPSSSWVDTPSPSGLYCKVCERVFAAGHLPTDGNLTCRDCRDEATRPPGPTLFDPNLFGPNGGDA